ncbi:MAG: Hpt domain-containing protein [Gammaproteobacteria bacterium]|nr:Hpt domain-containing protein [Gammaproteobacteria bacterium]
MTIKQTSPPLTASPEWQAVLVQTHGNVALARQLFSILAEELPGQCAEIEAQLQQRKWQAAGKIVHKLHGSSSFCGLTAVQTICAELESVLRKEQPPDATLIARFRLETNQLMQFLAQLAHCA